MHSKILTSSTLVNLVDLDQTEHKTKDLAKLFLEAMNDWPTFNQTSIQDFVSEFENYFGYPLTIDKISKRSFNGQNAWQVEAGASLSELIDISTKSFNRSNFQDIIRSILSFYEEEFSKVDFIAHLKYLTTEQGGRKTPARTSYRPQVKFDFTEMQTSGQQTFIDKEWVQPGEEVKAKIKILSPEIFAGCLYEGMKFEFREGPRIIGVGEILEIINSTLEKN